jgi:hypothetical protein
MESHVCRVRSLVVRMHRSMSGTCSSSPQMFSSDLRSVVTAPRVHSNSPSPWMLVMWNARFRQTPQMHCKALMSDPCLRLLSTLAVTNRTFFEIDMKNGMRLTNMMSTHRVTLRQCSMISFGRLFATAPRTVCSCCRVISAFEDATSRPNTAWALTASCRCRGQFGRELLSR